MLNKNRLFMIISRAVLLTFIFILAISASACDTKKSENTEENIPLPYVLNEIELDLGVNESFTLSVLNLGEEDVVIWSSNNEPTVSVSNGTVLGIKPGRATITATVGNKKLTCLVNVSIKLENVPVFLITNLIEDENVYTLNLIKGDEFKLEPQLIVGSNAQDVEISVQFDSENISIDNLCVKAVQTCQNVVVTLTCEYNGVIYSAVCKVSVGEVA